MSWDDIVDGSEIILTTVVPDLLDQVTLLRTKRYFGEKCWKITSRIVLLRSFNKMLNSLINVHVPQHLVPSALSDPMGTATTVVLTAGLCRGVIIFCIAFITWLILLHPWEDKSKNRPLKIVYIVTHIIWKLKSHFQLLTYGPEYPTSPFCPGAPMFPETPWKEWKVGEK